MNKPVLKIKICGITNYDDAAYVLDSGADAVGFVFAASRRQITPAKAKSIAVKLPLFAVKVGVFADAPLDDVRAVMDYCGLTLAQLHGNESMEYVHALAPFAYKAFTAKDENVIHNIKEYGVSTFMLDAFSMTAKGGTGITVEPGIAVKAVRLGNMILAGGLNPENVSGIVRAVKPYAVDVSSGVESKPGHKDKGLVKAFIDAARNYL